MRWWGVRGLLEGGRAGRVDEGAPATTAATARFESEGRRAATMRPVSMQWMT